VSNAFALAGVTAVLSELLRDGIVNHNINGVIGSTVGVSAVPPDRVVPANGTEHAQLNLFLHQVTPNKGWRNEGLPSRDTGGRSRLSNPPLALNLHYLLSAYSGADLQGEILLGFAMQVLHEIPVLTRDAIRTALATLPPPLDALADSGLDRQIEQIRIVPEYLNTEEMSKLWTATLSHLRPTAAYQASVVLIEATQPALSPLPVLSRGKVDPVTLRDAGVDVHPDLLPPFPQLESIAPDTKQAAAELGDKLIVSGHNLDGVALQYHLLFFNARLSLHLELTPESGSASATSVQFDLTGDIPAGVYAASLQLSKPNEDKPRVTNVVPLIIAPKITGGIPSSAHLDANGNLTLTPTCTPQVRPEQRVSLILGGAEVQAQSFSTATSTPSFIFERLPPDKYWVRLRIDGVDSLLVKRNVGEPPRFTGPRIEVLP
jgi:hypothetical protein